MKPFHEFFIFEIPEGQTIRDTFVNSRLANGVFLKNETDFDIDITSDYRRFIPCIPSKLTHKDLRVIRMLKNTKHLFLNEVLPKSEIFISRIKKEPFVNNIRITNVFEFECPVIIVDFKAFETFLVDYLENNSHLNLGYFASKCHPSVAKYYLPMQF